MQRILFFVLALLISISGFSQSFRQVEILMRVGLFENTNAAFVIGSSKNNVDYLFDTEENLSSSLLEFGAKISFLENHRFVVSLATFSNGQVLSGTLTDEFGMTTSVRPLVSKYKYLNFRIGHEVILPIGDSWAFYFQNALILQHLTNGASIKAIDIHNLNYTYAMELGFEIIINDMFNFNAGFTMFRYLKSYEKENVLGDFKPISYGLVLGFGYKLSEFNR